ncbi:bifunctional DNA-formamidopyrimidine glycosylase/DNA-(apurinic or apyrimidinic site) lyase [Legionella dresdenensis]|uniref:Formamidopyrimidine-DNA glycosylase n=1 Tax=Legionella dresdenensis TaxID=450200 RepID=A0ABV8CET2_9GAMM
MPELPEVETTRLAVAPCLLKQTIKQIIVRNAGLRQPVPDDLSLSAPGQQIRHISRRSKYLLIYLTQGCVLIHLGMSGHLRLLSNPVAPGKHDHIDMILSNGKILRYNDPRRFGLWLYLQDNPDLHPLIKNLGPEPLSDEFNDDYLSRQAVRKKTNVKSFIMNNHIVVGVGNIYATESLYRAGIHPLRAASTLTSNELQRLVTIIRQVLKEAIKAGGTTLKDFYVLDGKPGYFAQSLQVYGRNNQPCFQCASVIEMTRITGRASAYCPTCQPFLPLI